ncbi:hypothetical protein PsAD2_03655 [Pseudovibrio axinellae]|uniref:DUF2783 domain-containing protein n=1 Tax=Pseudovibrio axinellae TaxID=989403 RepID=A0A165VSY9_9HYPH|nr:DUF2783 domain-containing protein [Pseudovibrio axinellae]KZL15399.1 hypothetical protein PsAD2_03655 [Pseudovibrio axinellae]SER54766.1 Protein of unknown function [Pseudovibrio axinellae]
MSHLNTKANIAKADDFYEELLALHQGRSEKESEALNAKLVLILANHIGDRAVLREAIELAAKTQGGSKA